MLTARGLYALAVSTVLLTGAVGFGVGHLVTKPAVAWRNVVVQNGDKVYEIASPDDHKLEAAFRPLESDATGKIHNVSCAFKDGVICKATGPAGNETVKLDGSPMGAVKSFADNLYKNKLDAIERLDCTIQDGPDICVAVGSKIKPVHNDIVLTMNTPPAADVPATKEQ